MRENRLYGSAGGGARERSPYPHRPRMDFVTCPACPAPGGFRAGEDSRPAGSGCPVAAYLVSAPTALTCSTIFTAFLRGMSLAWKIAWISA